MKTIILSLMIIAGLASSTFAQKKIVVPAVVKSALVQKYPQSSSAKVTWETEKGNYEANWGGKSGEDNSVQFTPKGEFIEMVVAIPVSQLPKPVSDYVKGHYKSAKITEAGKVTDAQNKITYEAEVNGHDIIFDENGKYIKGEK